MKKTIFILIGIVFLLQGCMYMVRYDSTCRGRVIDAETGSPIEGVVVLGVWTREYPTVAGAIHKFHDARETVTDEEGEFEIAGQGLKVFSNVIPMNVLIFKAGYNYIKASCEFGGYYTRKIVKWEGSRAIIPLRKLEGVDLRRYGNPPSPPHEAPKEKIKLMLGEINKFRKLQGWGAIDVGR